jgi:hypothetical protein
VIPARTTTTSKNSFQQEQKWHKHRGMMTLLAAMVERHLQKPFRRHPLTLYLVKRRKRRITINQRIVENRQAAEV